MSQTIGGAECTTMLVEKLDGVVNSQGTLVTHDLSSELQCYSSLQQTDHKVVCKVRLSPFFELEQLT